MTKEELLDDIREAGETAIRRVRDAVDEAVASAASLAPSDAQMDAIAEGQAVPGIRKMPAQRPHKSKQDFATPMPFIRAVERRFGGIVHDLAAHSRNARCASYYSLEEGVDSLRQDWSRIRPGNRWLNPEFGNIAPFVEKCAMEAERLPRNSLILVLVPASIGTEWFARHVENKARVIGVRPRLSFDDQNPYPKDLMLLGYGLDYGLETWRWTDSLEESGAV
jgi:phage N-6-adenine-methyltransferase